MEAKERQRVETEGINAADESNREREEKEVEEVEKSGYTYGAVLDFEATCIEGKQLINQEIIEVPIVLIELRTRETVAEFHKYVKPLKNPTLSPFCVKLTGISQTTVGGAQPFPTVWKEMLMFLEEQGLTTTNCVFFTCGDWNLQKMLPQQCAMTNLRIPALLKTWRNIKTEYEAFYYAKVSSMTSILAHAGLPLIGRHHSGLDDARNIAAILKKMLIDGYSPGVSSWQSCQPCQP